MLYYRFGNIFQEKHLVFAFEIILNYLNRLLTACS